MANMNSLSWGYCPLRINLEMIPPYTSLLLFPFFHITVFRLYERYYLYPYNSLSFQRMTGSAETYCRVGGGGGGGGGGNGGGNVVGGGGGGGGGGLSVRGRHPTPAPRSVKSESEEYDTFGSDSDTDPPASSRTESSNQLDQDRSGPIRAVHHSKSLTTPDCCFHHNTLSLLFLTSHLRSVLSLSKYFLRCWIVFLYYAMVLIPLWLIIDFLSHYIKWYPLLSKWPLHWSMCYLVLLNLLYQFR